MRSRPSGKKNLQPNTVPDTIQGMDGQTLLDHLRARVAAAETEKDDMTVDVWAHYAKLVDHD